MVMSVPRVHPTALIDPAAEVAEGVTVGPFVVIEGPVRIGRGCTVRPHAHLIGPLTLGEENDVGTGAVLGERPQHVKCDGAGADLIVGDRNILREYVTIHRGSGLGDATRIGNDNFLMANSHVAHDCTVGDRCIFANGALLAGHCEMHDGAYLSGHAAVHQFCRLGRLAFLSGCSASTKDIPPFVMQQNINEVVGVNVVGMRRAGYATDQIDAVRQAYRVLFLQSLLLPTALEKLERDLGTVDAVVEMVAFIRASKHGINIAPGRRDRHRSAA